MFLLNLESLIEIVSEYMAYMKLNQTKEDEQAFETLSLQNPLIFFHKNLYLRINFVKQKNYIYLFLTIMNIGEKVLLLDLSDKL